jgi:peptidoglycan/LPS O-acetylase OafA/YrhL
VGYFGMTENKDRNYGIDLARTIAILGVVLVHAGVFNDGRFGVQLFFLVSGYLLADLGKLSARDFLIKRGFRLFPLYWIILLLFYRNDYDSFWQLLISISLIQSAHWIFTASPGSWSISNEWLYSLLLPLINRITKNSLLLLIGLSWISQFLTSFIVFKWGGILESESRSQYAMKIWLNTLNPAINLAFFLIGIGLKRDFIPILRNKLGAYVVLIVGLLSSSIFGIDMLFMWPPILWAVFSLCLNWHPRSNILKTSVTFIGQRTYGIFFIHFIILEYSRDFVWIKELPEFLGIKDWTLFAITFIVSSALAELTWRLVESPMIKFSRKLIRKR